MPRFLVSVNIPLTIVPDPLFGQMVTALKTQDIGTVFPHVLGALQHLAEQGQDIWAQKIAAVPGTEGRPLRLGTGPGDRMVQLNRTAYVDSLRVSPVAITPGAASVEVYSHNPQAAPIEDGSAAMNLHNVLSYAPKAKRSKAGHRYLSIPFRWATTGPGGPGGQRFQSKSNVLPGAVLRAMRHRRPSLRVGSYEEPSVNVAGTTTSRWRYSARPGRLRAAELTGLVKNPGSVEGRNLVGLMRVGEPRHRGYLTIRTLSEKEPGGWRVPGYPAQHLVQDTVRILQGLAGDGEYFHAALQSDALAWVGRSGGTA